MKRRFSLIISALVLAVCVAFGSVWGGNTSILKADTNTQFEFQKQGYKNSLDYLLARDGFIYGVDYNWCLDVEKGAFSMGDNQILGQKATYSPSVVERDFYNVKALGFNCTTWWLMGSGQGMIFDEDGLAIGVQDVFMKNLRHMLNTARKFDIPVIPCLIPHGEAHGYGKGNGIENQHDIRNKYFRFQWDETALDALIKNVIEPVCEVLSEYPDVVPVVSINIENMTGGVDDYEQGIFQYGHTGTTMEHYTRYLNALHDAVKKYMPLTPTTIEQAGGADLVDWADERMYFQNFLKVDLISENYYHSGGYIESVSNGYNTRPGFIGEYNGGESGFDDHSEQYWATIKHRFNKSAKENGWLGAFYFSFGAGGIDFAMSSDAANTGNYDKFYYWAIAFRADIQDQMNEFKGITSSDLEKSTLLYYQGGNYLYWIPARGAQYFDIERSSDGGKTWSVAAKNVDYDANSLSNGLMKYEIKDNKDQMNYKFRIISKTEDGQTSVSDPSNEAFFWLPPELISDGGFESKAFNSTGVDGWQGGQGVFSFETGVEGASGETALKVDTINNSASYTSFVQKIDTEPGNIYKLTYRYKADSYEYNPKNDYNEPASVAFINADTGKTITATFMGNTDGEWRDVTLLCNVGDIENVGIKYMTGTSNGKFTMYLDDFSVKQER